MARKVVKRSLPPLKAIFPGFRGIPQKRHRLDEASQMMRSAVQRLRKKQNQSFYSIREAAGFFSMPMSSMALVYRQLENEGLIVRIRGSRTVLLGKQVHSQHPARSIVSIPIKLSSLLSSHFTRRFCHRISDELWKYHYVANLILLNDSSETSSEFARRLIKQSDTVIWLLPGRGLRDAMLTLRDHGVHNIVLLASEDAFLPARYWMDWESTYRKLIFDWKASGISHFVLAKASRPDLKKSFDHFLLLLRQNNCTFSLAEGDAADLRAEVERQLKRKKRVGCAILEHEMSHRLCNDDPVIMAKLTTRCRVLFGRGRIHASYFFHRNFRADVVGFDGDEVAARVAKDLGGRKDRDESATLSPQWLPKANLRDVFI